MGTVLSRMVTGGGEPGVVPRHTVEWDSAGTAILEELAASRRRLLIGQFMPSIAVGWGAGTPMATQGDGTPTITAPTLTADGEGVPASLPVDFPGPQVQEVRPGHRLPLGHHAMAFDFMVTVEGLRRTWTLRKTAKQFVALNAALGLDLVLAQPEEAARGAARAHAPHPPPFPHTLLLGHALRELKADYRAHAARRLREWLLAVVGTPACMRCPSLHAFLEVSAATFNPLLGWRCKEGALLVNEEVGTTQPRLACVPSMGSDWTPCWGVLRNRGVLELYATPTDATLLNVLILQPDATIIAGRASRGSSLSCGPWAGTKVDPCSFTLATGDVHAEFRCPTEPDAAMWMSRLRQVQGWSEWTVPHRFGSFAPYRPVAAAQWIVDGRNTFLAILHAIHAAQHEILMAGWWLTPDLAVLRDPTSMSWLVGGGIRPAHPGADAGGGGTPGGEDTAAMRLYLKDALRKKAQEGVRVYVLTWQEPPLTLALASAYNKRLLKALGPNVYVMRHGSLFWTHHEKVVVVDRMTAFLGGLDVCFGRWDCGSHPISDPDKRFFPQGVEFYNSAYGDWVRVEDPWDDRFDRTQYPRMGWHDVHCCLHGPDGGVDDVVHHFVQRWNFTRRVKGKSKLPFLLPHPAWAVVTAAKVHGAPTTTAAATSASVPPTAVASGDDATPAAPTTAQVVPHLAPASPSRSGGGLPGYCDVDWTSHVHSVTAQVVRSVGSWSLGCETECSIYHAYVYSILNAQHHIYVENQYFLSSLGWDQETVTDLEVAAGALATHMGEMGAASAHASASAQPPVATATASAADVPLAWRPRMLDVITTAMTGEAPPPPPPTTAPATAPHAAEPNGPLAPGTRRGWAKLRHQLPQLRAPAPGAARDAPAPAGARRAPGAARRTMSQPPTAVTADTVSWLLQQHRRRRSQAGALSALPGEVSTPPAAARAAPPPTTGRGVAAWKRVSQLARGGALRTAEQEGGAEVTASTSAAPPSAAPAPAPPRGVSQLREGLMQGGGQERVPWQEVVAKWEPSTTSIAEAMYVRVAAAIQAEEAFNITILLPVHPDGPIRTQKATQLVLHWEHATISRGGWSLLERLRRRFPDVDLSRYISFYALRTWDIMPSGIAATEQVYVHSKVMIVDDRAVIIGSANMNDRSQYGDRDSEIAVLLVGGDTMLSRMAGEPWEVSTFAHTLRRNLWEEHLGLPHTCAAFHNDASHRLDNAQVEVAPLRQVDAAEIMAAPTITPQSTMSTSPQPAATAADTVVTASPPLTTTNVADATVGGGALPTAGIPLTSLPTRFGHRGGASLGGFVPDDKGVGGVDGKHAALYQLRNHVLASIRRAMGSSCAVHACQDPLLAHDIWHASALLNTTIYEAVFPGVISDRIHTLQQWREAEALPPRDPHLLPLTMGKVILWSTRFLEDEDLTTRVTEKEHYLPTKVVQ